VCYTGPMKIGHRSQETGDPDTPEVTRRKVKASRDSFVGGRGEFDSLTNMDYTWKSNGLQARLETLSRILELIVERKPNGFG